MRRSRHCEAVCLSSSVKDDTLTGVTRLQCFPTGQRCSLHQPRRMDFRDPPGIQRVVKRCSLRHRTTVLAPIRKPRRLTTTIVSAQREMAMAAMNQRRPAPAFSQAGVTKHPARRRRDEAHGDQKYRHSEGDRARGEVILSEQLQDLASSGIGECFVGVRTTHVRVLAHQLIARTRRYRPVELGEVGNTRPRQVVCKVAGAGPVSPVTPRRNGHHDLEREGYGAYRELFDHAGDKKGAHR